MSLMICGLVLGIIRGIYKCNKDSIVDVFLTPSVEAFKLGILGFIAEAVCRKTYIVGKIGDQAVGLTAHPTFQ